MQRFPEILFAFLRLGLTSFGGPVAHLAYCRHEFVARRHWLDDDTYAELVSLCQILPGPASSQVAIAIGLLRGGVGGSIAAWLGFTLPSAIALVLFSVALNRFGIAADAPWLHGLKVVAVAVVAQAIWAMGRTLCPDRSRASLAAAACVIVSWLPGAPGQIGVIVGGAAVGWACLPGAAGRPVRGLSVRLGKRVGLGLLLAYAALLALLPLVAQQTQDPGIALFERFYRAGALVFGGGHVVLPLLQSQVVPSGLVSNDLFLAGYGAAQAVPGPLFSFAAYLGATSAIAPNGWSGAAIALLGIFLPGYLLIVGALPLWTSARQRPAASRAMLGVNAAVVGLLLAAFFNPVWSGAIRSAPDFALAVTAFLMLSLWKAPSWAIVLFCAAAAALGWR